MKLQIIKKNELEKSVRATIQMSGKLGFTTEAAQKLGLSDDKTIVFSKDGDESIDGRLVLYMQVLSGQHEDGFRVNKAGQYFYLSAKALFDTFKVPYAKKSIALDLTKVVIDGDTYYRCIQREDKHKKDLT